MHLVPIGYVETYNTAMPANTGTYGPFCNTVCSFGAASVQSCLRTVTMRVQCSPTNTRLPARGAAASGSCRAHDVNVEKLTVGAAAFTLSALPALAADAGALSGDAATAAGAIVGVAGLGGLLVATDPQRRRNTMAEGAGGDEMSSVKDYFEGTGAFSSLLLRHRCAPHALRDLNG